MPQPETAAPPTPDDEAAPRADLPGTLSCVVEVEAGRLCPWVYDVPAADDPAKAAAVASAMGTSAEALTAIREDQRRRRIEADCNEHLRTHTLAEWVGTVDRLRRAYGAAMSQVQELTTLLTSQTASREADRDGR